MKTIASVKRFFGKYYRIYLPLLVLISLAACIPQSAAAPDIQTQPLETPSQNETLPVENTLNPGQSEHALLFRISKASGSGGQTNGPFEGGEYQLEVIDLRSGEPVEGLPGIDVGNMINYAYSPDRTQLALVAQGLDCSALCLRIHNLSDLQQTVNVDLPGVGVNGYINQMAFDSQAKQLVVTYNEYGKGRLALIDLSQTGTPVLQDVDFPYSTSRIAFTGDGSHLMVIAHLMKDLNAGSEELTPRLHVLLLDTEALQTQWDQILEGVNDGFYGSQDHNKFEESAFYSAGIASDADSQKFYIAHADAEKLTTVDFQHRLVKTVVIREPSSWMESMIEFVFSIGVHPVQAKAGNTFSRQALLAPNGCTLYVTGERINMVKKNEQEYEFIQTAYGLAIWEIESGTKLLQVDTDTSQIRQGIGGTILLSGYDWNSPVYHPYTQIFDPATGEITAQLEDAFAYLSLRTDGTPVLVSDYLNNRGDTVLSVYEGNSLEPEILWSTKVNGDALWPEYR